MLLFFGYLTCKWGADLDVGQLAASWRLEGHDIQSFLHLWSVPT